MFFSAESKWRVVVGVKWMVPMGCQARILLHFVAFFHVASLFSTGVDNKKVGVDNEKALELTNSTVFHRGRQ